MLPLRILRALLPPAERAEVIADLETEYGARRARDGHLASNRWLWGQLLASGPTLLRRSWWRGRTGFESAGNAMNPGGPLMERWIVEARFALRRLRTRPTYTLLAVLTLALGVGGMAAIAGIVRPLLVNPLPYPRDNELAMFWAKYAWHSREFVTLRPQWAGFASVAAYRPDEVTVEIERAPTRFVSGIASSTELFDVLGVAPRIGRGFHAGEDAQSAERVAVLSDALWRELGADPSLVGKSLKLDGIPRTVIGIMPPGFWFPNPSVRVWLADYLNPTGRSGMYGLVGRVAPGQSVLQMQPMVDRVTQLLGSLYTYPPEWDRTKNARLTPLRDDIIGGMRPALFATLAAMAVIMLIACANVAALMLGQVESRSAELALRSALGADRGRIVSQLVMESLVIGLVSGFVGTVFAVAGFNVLRGALPLGAWSDRPALDWTLFGAAMIVAILASLAVALLPAYSVWRSDLRTHLSGARAGGKLQRRGGLQVFVVVGEVAAAVLLACGAGLLMRSVTNLYAIKPGIETRGIAVVDIATPANMRRAARRELLSTIVHELSVLPGVKTAAVAQKLPLREKGNSSGITVPGAPVGVPTTAFFRVGSADYFKVLGIPVLAGRTFDGSERTDSANAEMSVVINEALAKIYYPTINPVGQVMTGGFGMPERIVGVVGNVTEASLTDPPAPVRYYLTGQSPWIWESQSLVIRTTRPEDAVAIIAAVRRTIAKVAPSVAVQEATTMQRVLDRAVGPARDVRTLLAILSALALLLGAIGIYGVIAQYVARREGDWSIRVALGLSPSRVISLVVAHGTWMVVVGILLGVGGAVALGRFLSTLLYGVTAADPITIIGASIALLTIGVVAALIPALRASRADPALVLRKL